MQSLPLSARTRFPYKQESTTLAATSGKTRTARPKRRAFCHHHGGSRRRRGQGLYGGKKGQQGFGNALYEIKEEKRKGCNYKAEIATFYKDYLVIRNADKKACPVPMRHVAGTWA